MTILRERAQGTNNRVTAGLPSLTPERRFYLTEDILKRVYQQELQAESRRNDEYAADPGDGARTMAEWDAQIGIPLQGERIIGRLRRLNHNLFFERSKSDGSKYGVYLLKPEAERGLEFICGFEVETNPEFTVIIQDDKGGFKKFIPGWRRLLMRLIRAKLITESGAHRMFGPPNRDSERWARFIQ